MEVGKTKEHFIIRYNGFLKAPPALLLIFFCHIFQFKKNTIYSQNLANGMMPPFFRHVSVFKTVISYSISTGGRNLKMVNNVFVTFLIPKLSNLTTLCLFCN